MVRVRVNHLGMLPATWLTQSGPAVLRR